MALIDLADLRLLLAAGIIVLVGWVAWSIMADIMIQRKYRFPNLVPGLPLIGNALQIPKIDQGPYLQKLGRQYGEMFTLKFGSTYWVVANSRRVAYELLEKRASIYSSRMSLPMAHHIVSGEKRMVLMPYGESWRLQRKLMHQVLNISQQRIFKPFQDLESRALMYELLEQPQNWYLSLGRFSSSVILNVTFGRRTSHGDPRFLAIFKAQEEFVPYTMPGASIVDSFPFLARIPVLKKFQPWRWKGDAIYERTITAFKQFLDDLERRVKEGKQKDCFMTQLLASKEAKFTRDETAFIAVTLLEAGSDTTRNSLLEVVAGTALYPDWVPRARAELDEVCGKNAERLPTFDDIERLPMIRAAVKEAVRWRPTNTQTGVPHALTADDEFEGYRFPKGTVVTWNQWAIANDPNEYDQPERFYPDRFLDEELDKPQKGHLGFGAGRRMCVGYNVAASNLFIAISRLIYCFDIEQDQAHPIVVDKPFPLTAVVEPYKVKFKPRSDAHRRLIIRECQEAAVIDSKA
ncbi:uncharacterized protein A1O5_05638 [Cladophialophora psammophila CBS 110553]|uniref:Cytochrome P450 oxidoreductase n=1 Tax=Cladophialophora psammophila CBS 110553 TaxID=1182543 RepID=W9WRT5_9EURO|nr:uncharacterized protein A1O5_05638 [Cladophialophora psammophila CBS 110553]EXJ70648.1 hypothetical protein A1O5_05638 [Cladophialophora psammophila CBS 110553]